MATLYTDIATKNNLENLKDRVNSNQLGSGRINFLTALYTCTAEEATSGDSIQIGDLPIGAIVIPELCRVSNDGAGGTLAVTKLGDSADDDRYSATSINAGTAGNVAVTPIAGAQNVYQVTSTTKRLLATITSASAPTAGKLVYFRIAYLVP